MAQNSEACFDFEKPIVLLERKLQEMRELSQTGGVDFSQEIVLLERKVEALLEDTTSKLTPWQRVQLSRHPNRPYARDYIDALFPDFMELQGDRAFGDDQAMLGGVGTWVIPASKTSPEQAVPVLILGHQKGRSTKQKMERNFGMVKPEGYRKAIRLMQMAERARMPVLCFIDTPGAYPGADAEQRGQAQAIAESIHQMCELTVPVLSLVIGEGGSGGALAIGVANQVLMQEFSTYSVISPESCASILWSDATLASRAAERLKMAPSELLKQGVIDGIIPEPKGGAHRDWPKAFQSVRETLHARWDRDLLEALGAPSAPPKTKTKSAGTKPQRDFQAERLQKFRRIGEGALGHAPASN